MGICFSLCSYTTFLRFFYVAFSDFSIVVLYYMFNVSSATIAYFDAVSVEDLICALCENIYIHILNTY